MSLLRCVALTFACPLAAQAVHLVGPGGFAEISTAIAAAAPGDVIEVQAGNYAPFTLDKALTITARPSAPGTLVQVINMTTAARVTVLRPPAGTRAFVTGLHFRNLSPSFFWLMDTRVERGTVCFEECSFQGRDSQDPALLVRNAEVVLRHCEILGGGGGNFGATTGLRCDNAAAFLIDCFVRAGSLGIESSQNSGDGITADNSQLHLVRVDVIGGASEFITCFHGFSGGAAVRLRGTSRAWIADCTLQGGNGVCARGGDGLHNATTVPVQLARTIITAGPGATSGLAMVGPTVQQPLLGLFGTTTGLVRGRYWQAHYKTQPQWPVVVAMALDVLPAADPRIAEWLLLPPAGAATFVLMLADFGGNAVVQTTVPANASLQHRMFFLQAFTGLGLPLRTAPPLGGVVR